MTRLEKAMARTYIAKAKTAIQHHCDVETQRVVAIATVGYGAIIGIETNRRGEGKVSKWSQHAEERLAHKLQSMRLREKNITISVIRWKRDGTLGMAKPCSGCMSLISGKGSARYWCSEHRMFEDRRGDDHDPIAKCVQWTTGDGVTFGRKYFATPFD